MGFQRTLLRFLLQKVNHVVYCKELSGLTKFCDAMRLHLIYFCIIQTAVVPRYVKYHNSLKAWKIDFVPIALKRNTNNRQQIYLILLCFC